MNTLSSETHRPLRISPSLLLHIEGAVVLIGAVALYATQSGNWLLFALLFFAPDLSALGYLLEKRQPQSSQKNHGHGESQLLSPLSSNTNQDTRENMKSSADASRGNLAYNLAHTLESPALLAAYGLLTGNVVAVSLALIWFAHIGMDRMVGYTLKG